MSHFRLLHISDFHFGQVVNNLNMLTLLTSVSGDRVSDEFRAREGTFAYNKSLLHLNTHSDGAAFAVARFAYDREDDFDAVIVSGDLASTGQMPDLAVAASYFLEEPPEHFFEMRTDKAFFPSRRKKIIVAGNHDRYTNIFAGPGGTNFDEVFEGHVPKGRRVYSFTRKKQNESLAVICGDFTFQSSVDVPGWSKEDVIARYGQGISYDHLVQEMIAETKRRRDERPGALIIWCIHFAPFDCQEDLRLRDHHKLTAAAQELGVRILLCGHTHSSHVLKSGNLAILVAGSATCCTDPRNYIHMIDIKIDRGKLVLVRENYRLDEANMQFIPDQSSPRDTVFN